jgi:hypothetical protein
VPGSPPALARRAVVPTVIVALAAAVALAVAACGGHNAQHTPNLAQLPLVDGTRVVTSVRTCDPGKNAYCAWELVVSGARYRSSEALLKALHHYLRVRGWTSANADTGQQRAQDSPGHRLRVTYATADGDLRGIDLGWIKRSRPVQLALSRSIFEHVPTLSILYEAGAS